MGNWSDAYESAKKQTIQGMWDYAYRQYGYDNVVPVYNIPGRPNIPVHTYNQVFEFYFLVEKEDVVEVGSKDHIGVYSDGTTVLLDSKPIYGTAYSASCKKDSGSAWISFAVLKNAADAGTYIKLNNDNNRSVYEYDFKNKGEQNEPKAREFLKKKIIHEGFVSLALSLTIFLFALIPSIIGDPSMLNQLHTIGLYLTGGATLYHIIYLFIRKRGEIYYLRASQEDRYSKRTKTLAFANAIYMALLLLIFAFTRPCWELLTIGSILLIIFSIVSIIGTLHGYGYISSGAEVHKRMLQRRETREYKDYCARSVAFCKRAFK
ncbi:MAG: hypothetical protein MJ238_07045 [Bacilli bacterium]|nr:hypothetical protein [Bacilli bacterium]